MEESKEKAEEASEKAKEAGKGLWRRPRLPIRTSAGR
jgi:endonuclease YncB( thermonuclease family)